MLMVPGSARPDRWPRKAIKIVVGREVGGGADGTARLLAPLLQAKLGASRISVTNMAGASGAIAARYVRSHSPDGHHWLVAGGFHQGLRAMGFDNAVPYMDWQYFGADSSIMSFAVRQDSPITDMEDMVRRGIDNPDRLSMSVDGIGGTWHLGALLVMHATGARYRIVPYGGGKPATVAGIQGEVDIVCSGVHEQIGPIRSRLLRPLGAGSSHPITLHGETLPSILDAVPKLADKTPIGGGAAIGLSRDTDRDLLTKLADAWATTLKSVDVKQALELHGRFPALAIGEAADRSAALHETVAANLLSGMGVSKHSPEDLGLPTIDEFDNWWPPKGYSPRI
jgi:tripartite-type tricarboxylate transporter receptor subunit TctC